MADRFCKPRGASSRSCAYRPVTLPGLPGRIGTAVGSKNMFDPTEPETHVTLTLTAFGQTHSTIATGAPERPFAPPLPFRTLRAGEVATGVVIRKA